MTQLENKSGQNNQTASDSTVEKQYLDGERWKPARPPLAVKTKDGITMQPIYKTGPARQGATDKKWQLQGATDKKWQLIQDILP